MFERHRLNRVQAIRALQALARVAGLFVAADTHVNLAGAHRGDRTDGAEDHGEAEEEGIATFARLPLKVAVVEVEADLTLGHVSEAILALHARRKLDAARRHHAVPLEGILIF